MCDKNDGRRGRARRATIHEIRETTRSLLVEHGSTAVTINAVARRMGVSGPALYHYYPSRDALIDDVTGAFIEEMTATMTAARDSRAGATAGERILATARELRAWAVAHPAEFGWVFADRATQEPDSARHRAFQRFEQVFGEPIAEIWDSARFPAPRRADLPEGLWEQLTDYAETLDDRLPPEAVHVFVQCWVRLYGLLCMEVFHQLDFVFSDVEPVFELCLRDLSIALGFEYSPAAGA